MAKHEGCDNFIRCDDSPAPRFCVNKETFCSINDLSRKIKRLLFLKRRRLSTSFKWKQTHLTILCG